MVKNMRRSQQDGLKYAQVELALLHYTRQHEHKHAYAAIVMSIIFSYASMNNLSAYEDMIVTMRELCVTAENTFSEKQIYDALRYLAKHKFITMSYVKDCKRYSICVNQVQYETLLNNYINNSVNFTWIKVHYCFLRFGLKYAGTNVEYLLSKTYQNAVDGYLPFQRSRAYVSNMLAGEFSERTVQRMEEILIDTGIIDRKIVSKHKENTYSRSRYFSINKEKILNLIISHVNECKHNTVEICELMYEEDNTNSTYAADGLPTSSGNATAADFTDEIF